MGWGGLGKIKDAVSGVVGDITGKNAKDAAKRASKQAEAADEARLEFEREQWEEWQDTYGGIEDRLAIYYDQLSPSLRTVQGLQAYEQERDRSMRQFNERMAQMNISRSGIAAQTNLTADLASAAERARIRANAPMETAREQASFLQIGLGQNPDAGVRGALAGQQSTAAEIAAQTGAAAGQARGAFIDRLIGAGQFLATGGGAGPANPGIQSSLPPEIARYGRGW